MHAAKTQTGLFAICFVLMFSFAILNITRRVTAADHPVPESPLWLTYSGDKGPGAGKHIVLIAAD